MTNAFPRLLHVGKLKKPSRQFCQQFTEMYLISGVELSHECNLILLNYHSKMPKCLVFIHWIEGVLLTLSHFQLMREETSKTYAGSPLSPHDPLNAVILMSTPEQNITFHCGSKPTPWIIFLWNLRSKGWMLIATSFICLSTNKRTHWYKGQFEPGVQFSESMCSISLMWVEHLTGGCYLWTAVSGIVFHKWQDGTWDYLSSVVSSLWFLLCSEVSCVKGKVRTDYQRRMQTVWCTAGTFC